MALENLTSEKWLEREGDQYYFKMDLFRQWFRQGLGMQLAYRF